MGKKKGKAPKRHTFFLRTGEASKGKIRLRQLRDQANRVAEEREGKKGEKSAALFL